MNAPDAPRPALGELARLATEAAAVTTYPTWCTMPTEPGDNHHGRGWLQVWACDPQDGGTTGLPGNLVAPKPIAEFIAACSPAVVLQLVALATGGATAMQQQTAGGSTMKSASPNQPQGLVPSRDAGRALDALIAEKVMGLPLAADARVSRGGTVDPYFRDEDADARESWYPNGMRCRRVPRYSTDMSAAWLVVRRLRLLGYVLLFQQSSADESICSVFGLKNWHAASGWSKCAGAEMPLAICRAALAAKENPDA